MLLILGRKNEQPESTTTSDTKKKETSIHGGHLSPYLIYLIGCKIKKVKLPKQLDFIFFSKKY